MKSIVVMTLALVSLSAMARPVSLDLVTFDKVRALNKVDELRVMVSRDVVIRHSNKLENTDVNDDVNSSIVNHMLDKSLSKKVRGKIIDVEDYLGKLDMIWVSFDKNCLHRSCSLGFRRTEVKDKNDKWFYNFALAEVPSETGYTYKTVSYRTKFLRRLKPAIRSGVIGCRQILTATNLDCTPLATIQVNMDEVIKNILKKDAYEGY